mmetsp:Transcript_10941/g.35942  ORF Transcript_10941/g.35942 Transcript_10941/m.35942 type:complete len:419 (+) Transcript_10941:129-1385(+)
MLAGWAVSASAALADAVIDGDGLAVLIVYFGPLPPWLPLTLASMAANPTVSFSVVGDAPPPYTGLPPNVRFETVGWVEMQARLGALSGRRVSYTRQYKANDIKPFAPALFPRHLAGREWWAWADLDVVFGDLLTFLHAAATKPACCKVPLQPNGLPESLSKVNVFTHKFACPCEPGVTANVVTPLYPNPWRKKAWGPFTAFRTDLGTSMFRESPQWRAILASNDYAHFDEFWGPFHYSRGWETMGDVLTRLAEANGTVRMSKRKMPFAEARTCRDESCMFCPCGAVELRLARSGTLYVNGKEVMLLHLATSKYAWYRRAPLPAWSPAPEAPEGGLWASGCVEATGLGWLNETCATCSAKAPVWEGPGWKEYFQASVTTRKATSLTRHRVQTKWGGHINYATAPHEVKLSVGTCSRWRG